MTMDEGFPARVLRTGAYCWVCRAVFAHQLGGVASFAGWTVGSAISLLSFWSAERVVRRTFVPNAPDARSRISRYSFLKMSLIAAVLAACVLLAGGRAPFIFGLCAGVALVPSVIALKALGRIITRK